MKDQLIQLFYHFESVALYFSIFLNIFISVLGVIPSAFITAANITFFGFVEGTIVSFIGEAIGAIVSFILYRLGIRKFLKSNFIVHPKLNKLLNAEGKEAFFLILSLRLLPFVPSGAVTFIAAIGKSSLFIFFMASTLGKAPALLLEAYSINEVIQWTWQGKAVLVILAIVLLIIVWKKMRGRSN